MQQRMRDYLEPLSSFAHNIANLGLHSPGRYVGFDNILVSTVGALTLRHNLTGKVFKNELGANSNPTAMIMTRQGLICMEDENITGITLDVNTTNNSVRFDLIVATHDFTFVDGGAAVTYSVIKGPLASTAKPVLADPITQIALGYVKIPANSADFVGCEWIKAKSPDSGDGEDARLSEVNQFSKLQNFRELPAGDVAVAPAGYTMPGSDFVVIKATGNSLVYVPGSNVTIGAIAFDGLELQPGLELTLLINDKVSLRDRGISAPEIAQGFKGIKIANEDVAIDSPRRLVIPSGKKAIVNLTLFSDNLFYVTNIKFIDYIPIKDGFKRGMLIDVQMTTDEMSANFSTSGLGVGDWEGFALPNGNTYPLPTGGTYTAVDLRGRMRITANGLLSVGAPTYDTDLGSYTVLAPAGNKKFTIAASNIPKHHFKIFGSAGDTGTDIGANDTVRPAHSDGGNLGYRMVKTDGVAEADLGKTNSFGGNGSGGTDPIELLPPVMPLITVIKLY